MGKQRRSILNPEKKLRHPHRNYYHKFGLVADKKDFDLKFDPG